MLKNRQEGLVSLHGFCVTVTLALFYLLWVDIMRDTGLVKFNDNTRISLYLLGVVAGTLISSRGYRTVAGRLGYLSWIELFQITYRQLVRIALVLFAIAFATKDTDISRAFLISYMIAASALLYLLNCILPVMLSRFFFKQNAIRTLFIGPPAQVRKLRGWIGQKAHLGLEPVGYLSDTDDGADTCTFTSFGRVDNLGRVLAEQNVGQIVIIQFYLNHQRSAELIKIAQRHGCRVHLSSNLSTYYDHPVTVDTEGEYTFFTLDDEPLENPVNRMVKRVFDIAVSLPVVVLVLPPLTFAVWFFQRLQSPGPIFYPQLRSGINKKRFNIWKFRTMHVAAQTREQERVQARQGDSRVFAFGRFLRRTSLDEMPQFINVLTGEMSVSGPRPHMIEHDEEFAKLLNNYYSRHFVKPGITGLAQSMGYRGEVSEVSLLRKRISYDIEYINRWSLLLDIKILFATVRHVIFPPKTAY